MASAARQGLDLLLEAHPDFDLLTIDWGLVEREWGAWRKSEIDGTDSVWVIVVLGQPSADGSPTWARHHFAIWKTTGAVHGLQHSGAVTDDPLFGPDRIRPRSPDGWGD